MGKYKLKYMFIIFTSIFLMLSSNLHSTPLLDSLNVKFIGNWPFGYSSSITYDSTRNLVFCSAGGGAYIIDITDPQNPVKISDLRTRGAIIEEMSFDPSLSRIYLAVDRAGLEIWDLTDPSNPVRTGVLRDYLAYPRDIFVDDTLAYLVDGYHLFIVNVKDQYNPFIVSSYSFTNRAYGIYVAGNYAYVANWSGGLRIIDIQDPSNPQEVGHYTTPAAQDVCVNGNYAYILDISSGLYIINIQDPSNPYEVSQLSVPAPYSLYKISFKGSFVYLSHGEYGLRIIDVSDPYNPLEVGVYNSPGTVIDAEIYDHYAYIADGRDGLRVVDIQDPSNPSELGQYDAPWFFVDVEVSGNYAFAVDMDHTLYILDVQNPQQPYEVGKYTVQGAIYAYEVNVSGNYVYLACGNHGLEIIDVQDPSNPQPVGSFNISADRVFLYGSYVYLCSGTGGINIIDVQDPSNPQLIGNYQTPGYASSVFVSGNLAYVTDQDSGLIILDVQDPSNPVRVGLYTLPPTNYTMNLYVKNNIAYVSHINGIFIIDVQDPSNPVQVGFYNGGGRSDIFASDIYLYIFGIRLEVIDVSDPSNPYLTGYYNTPVSTGRGYVRNNLIYVSDQNCGIQIYSNLLVKVKEQNLRPILIYGSGKGVLFTKDRFIKTGLNKNKIYDILGRKKLSFSNGNIYFYNVKNKKVKIIVF